MGANIDTTVGANYNEDKFARMKRVWPKIMRKAMQLTQIELPKDILNKVAKAYNSNKSKEPLKNKETKTRSR